MMSWSFFLCFSSTHHQARIEHSSTSPSCPHHGRVSHKRLRKYLEIRPVSVIVVVLHVVLQVKPCHVPGTAREKENDGTTNWMTIPCTLVGCAALLVWKRKSKHGTCRLVNTCLECHSVPLFSNFWLHESWGLVHLGAWGIVDVARWNAMKPSLAMTLVAWAWLIRPIISHRSIII